MHLHGVRVVILDEAHHMLYAGTGTRGSTLQEQLEWLKSMGSTTGALHILVGTYDLLNFGRLNGQTARRSLPIHFPRYQLRREKDCIEFQAALLALLQKVPLTCDAETFVRYHWLYFYERSIGCIGVLKGWLLRAVSTALDEGQDTLTLDWVQDQASLVDQCRQMALDATEGEQKLNHTESNREHLWRLLQGGELIAPVPPLPPRGTLPIPSPALEANTVAPQPSIEPPPQPSSSLEASAPPVKRQGPGRSRRRIRQSRPGFRSRVRANPHKMYHRNDQDEEGKRPRSCRLNPSNSLSLRFQQREVRASQQVRWRSELRLQKSRPNAPVALGSASLNGISLANQSQNATNGELGELSQQFPRVLFYP